MGILCSSATKREPSACHTSKMIIKLTPCLAVCVALMTCIQGDTIKRLEREENYMEKMIMKDVTTVTNLLEDIPQMRMKRDTTCQSILTKSNKCIEDATIQFILQMEVTEIPA